MLAANSLSGNYEMEQKLEWVVGAGSDCTWDKENHTAPNPSSKASALFPKVLELSLNQKTVQVGRLSGEPRVVILLGTWLDRHSHMGLMHIHPQDTGVQPPAGCRARLNTGQGVQSSDLRIQRMGAWGQVVVRAMFNLSLLLMCICFAFAGKKQKEGELFVLAHGGSSREPGPSGLCRVWR